MAILSWNGRHHLEICLPIVLAQDDPGVDWEVLVLDNGSTDGTAAWIRERFGGERRVRLIESPVNLGFCAGNNRLVEAADGDAVVFLNNDTRPVPEWLSSLVDTLASAPPDVAAVSGKIVDWEGRHLDFARGVMTFDGHAFQLDFRRPLDHARIPAAGEDLLFACGGNMIVRRDSFLATGGFDESYFAYLEDVDLGWRLWQGGERVLFTPHAVIHHRSSATSDLLGLFNRGFLFERNAFLTAYKNYESGLWDRMMPAVMLALLSRTRTMLVWNNPGASTFLIDPYSGHIANTAGAAPAPPPAGPLTLGKLAGKWKELGPREFLRRGTAKLRSRIAPLSPSAPAPPQITDERTVAQFRAIHNLLANLDRAAAAREAVQKRRKRSDREIFERFPLYVVPTYPGDEDLFASEGFRAWLPGEVPVVRCGLGEVMEMAE
ncbi:MAG: glycosyltransferase family 2 protein [Thermoanaerobaculia bacterium]